MQSGSIGSHNPVLRTAGLQSQPVAKGQVEASQARPTASAPAAGGTLSSPSAVERDGVTYRMEGGAVTSRQTRSGVRVQHGSESQVFSLPGGPTLEVGVEQGGGNARYDLSRLSVAEGEVEGLGSTRNEEGLELISFRDGDGNTVALEPGSLTYEIRNKHDNLSQVYHPDGHQEVVVFGTMRGENGTVEPFENRALYSPEGELESARGFQDYRVEGDRVRFEMPNGQSASRSLVRSLPGQPAQSAPTTDTPIVGTGSAPLDAAPSAGEALSLGVTGPLLLGGGLEPLPELPQEGSAPAGPSFLELANRQLQAEGREPIADRAATAPATETAPAVSSAPAAKIEDQSEAEVAPGATGPGRATPATGPASEAAPGPFAHLTDISDDFLAGGDRDGVELGQLGNGVLVRDEGESRAFKLPNGHAFRTDGENVEAFGDPSEIRQLRLTAEDDRGLVAYSDRRGNRYKVDLDSGSWEVSNRQGSSTQRFEADGSQDFHARGTYTTEAGTPQQYHHKASFAADGTLKSADGFAGLKVEGDRLVFTLPNGLETGRTLVEPTELKYEAPKEKQPLSSGVADGWGKALNVAKQRFTSEAGAAAGPSPGPEPGDAPDPVSLPATPSGLTREPLPEGGTATSLPNGIVLSDLPPAADGTERAYATDADGSRLEVTRSLYATEGGALGTLLSFNAMNGTSYVLSDQHLDMIVGSPDGKVQQMVRAGGEILTAVTDGPNRFLHETGTLEGWQMGSPGVGVDPSAPNFLQVQGAPNGGYPLPWSTASPRATETGVEGDPFSDSPGLEPGYPEAGRASAHARPGQPQQGFQPSFWQRLKGAFTGENPWTDPAQGAAQHSAASGPSYGGAHAPPPQFGGFPGAQYGGSGGFVADPYLEEIQRTDRAMLTMNMATMALSALPMMFYGSYMLF